MILVGLTGFLNELFGTDVVGTYTSGSIPIEDVIFLILGVFVLSLLILFTYKRSYQTTVYNKSFAISLPLLAMITSVIIITVSSNIILSLGMVGALSIVRFRTAIKNPLDTVFVFWAVGLGITLGAGFYVLGLVSTVLIMFSIFLLIALEVFVQSYFLIIRADSFAKEEEVLAHVKSIYGKFTLRNKTVKKDQLDLTLEVRSKDDKYTLINDIAKMEGVKSVILLSHQGDYIAE